LGSAYEGEIATIRAGRLNEVQKGKLIKQMTDDAAQAYSKILTRYPVMNRAPDAKARLEALHRPVPKPTAQALAQNRREEESRRQAGMLAKVMGNLHKHPDMSEAARVGNPTLVDPKVTSATEVAREAYRALSTPNSSAGTAKVAGEIVGTGAPPPNQAVPHSGDANPPADAAEPKATTTDAGAPAAADSGGAAAGPENTGIDELKPNVPPDAAGPATGASNPAATGTAQPAGQPNDPAAPVTTPAQTTDGGAPLPPPQQVNEAATGADGGNTAAGDRATSPDSAVKDAAGQPSNGDSGDPTYSSSRKKKKKGVHKLNPF
jgi:outer membrane protein assembly factor BamD